MGMYDYQRQAELLKAMAHPVRLQILDLLGGGEVCVCHVEAALGRRQAYISQQLMLLREAGIVESRKDGLQVYYRLANRDVEKMLAVLQASSGTSHEQRLENCRCPRCAATPVPETMSQGDSACCR